MTKAVFLYQIFVLIGIYFLSMYREVLEGSHWGTVKLTNPKHEHRTERQSIIVYQSIISTVEIAYNSHFWDH